MSRAESNGALHLNEPGHRIDVDAAYKNGLLTITIAKHPGAKPKRINVRHA